MSRLWDTPEFWVRSEADELLRDFPNTEVRALARMSEQNPESYDGDPAFAREITAELYKRADAGVRFWPEATEVASLEHEVRALLETSAAELTKETAFWWQRM